MRTLRSVAIVFVAIATLFSFGLASSLAQDSTPTAPPETIPTPSPATTPTPSPAPTSPPAETPTVAPGAPPQGVAYPVAIHQGACPQPTPEPEINLSDTIVAGSDSEDATFVGVTPGQPALVSSTEAEIGLEDLAGVERVIALHKSAEEFDTLVACGTISGEMANDELVVTLQPVENSGVSGVAVLSDNDGKTDIKVYVLSPEAVPATPGAPSTPAS